MPSVADKALLHVAGVNSLGVAVADAYNLAQINFVDPKAVVCGVDDPKELKGYALFLLNAIYIDIGAERAFDFLLKDYKGELPLDLSLAVMDEGRRTNQISALMKKQDKHVRKLLRGNQGLQRKVRDFYEKPVDPKKTLAS